jgi:peptide deformylase
MAVYAVLRIGDPRLLMAAEPVEKFDTPELHQLVEDLKDTMKAHEGAGLAATQIGVMQRVVIFGVEHNPRYPEAEEVPMTVLVNPVITPLTDERVEDWEGCLSVPGMRGIVPRFSRIRYTAHDPFGNPIDREADGFHARVVQHECDHLDGVLYPQRIENMRAFGYTEELYQGGAFGEVMPVEE